MKSVCLAILCLATLATAGTAQKKIVLKTQKEKVSYSIGVNIASNLKAQSFDIDQEILIRGIQDAFAGNKPLLTHEEMQKVMTEFQSQMMTKQHEAAKVLGEKNKKEGNAFLTANKKKDGVVTLPSGLQYRVLTAGTGPIPKSGQTITANYRGTLIDGTEFDNSYKRGTPLSISVDGVIPGWSEALKLMPVGSKWELYIPSDLAYGEAGYGNDIGPNATLIFQVELLSVK